MCVNIEILGLVSILCIHGYVSHVIISANEIHCQQNDLLVMSVLTHVSWCQYDITSLAEAHMI